MTKFINLTSDYSDFEFSRIYNNEDKNKMDLVLVWKGAVDFSNFSTVGLYDFEIFPIISKSQGYNIIISTNIIQGGLHNPTKIIARRHIGPHTHSIPQVESFGMFTFRMKVT